ncbi:hypothetical protein JCM6882_007732 [Rhodosporidiobolus microsporus]
MPLQHALALSTLPTLCLVKVVASASTNPSSLPHLDHLALVALDATTEPTPPPSLEDWLDRLAGHDPSEALVGAVDDIRAQVQKVRRRGLDAAVSWAHNEMKPLVAWNEDDEVSLHTFPLLRSSPLGMYLRRTYLQLSKMSFDEAVGWWEAVGGWCEGTLGKQGGAGERDVAQRFAQARLRQDYHASRELVRSFATTSVGGSDRSSPQQALLHLALVEYEDGGFEAAQQALDDATQIARTMGDVACLSACSSLRKRLFTAAPSLASSSSSSPPETSSSAAAGLSTKLTSNPNAPYDLLHSLGASAPSTPLPTLFSPLYASLALYQHHSFPPIPPSSSASGAHHHPHKKEEEQRPLPPPGTEDGGYAAEFGAAWECAAAGVWDEMGITPLSTLHNSLSLSHLSPSRPSWPIKLSVLSRRAARLARAGRHDEALEELFVAVESREGRAGMGVREVRGWRECVEWVEGEREGRRSGRFDPTAPDSDQLPLPTNLSTSLLALQSSLSTSRHPSTLLSFLSVVDARLSLASTPAEGERGLREVEEVWGGVLALGGGGAGGEGKGGEWRIVEARAREVKARCLIVACQAEDTQLPAAVELLEEALEIYSLLSLPLPTLRALSTLIHLCSHLSTSPSLPPTSAAHWRGKRDTYAGRWVEVTREMEERKRGDGGDAEERERRERRERVGEAVRAVERAVEASVGVRR